MRDRSLLANAIDIGKTAYRLLKIAKAAAIAGVKGALLETTKQFAPTFIKVMTGIVIALIGLPFLVFATLPNIFFGYKSSGVTDIKAMTDKATIIQEAYKSTKDYNAKKVNEIIDQMKEGYDDVKIDEDIDNTNDYWFIAICSVAYKQDLFEMNPEDIKNKSIFKFDLFSFVTTEEEYEQQDGELVKQLKRLKVSVKDMNPEEIMQQLSFTEEEKNWTRAIYNSMVDDQSFRPGTQFYEAGPDIEYKDIIFKNGATDVVYYSQRDPKWGNKLYGKYDTIEVAGCGPTSLAMVVSSLTGQHIDPGQMADWAYKNGYRVEGSGSKHSLIPEGARNFGLNVEGAGKGEGQKIVDALANGKLVVAIMGPGHFTSGGHFIVLRGVTEDGKILVADPYSTRKTNMAWDLSIILSEARSGAGAGGPFWIVGL